jgi:hypothetical protein
MYGSGHNAYKVHRANNRPPVRGFVPFIYKMDKVIGQNVTGWRVCSVYECGVERHDNDNVYIYQVIPEKWQRFVYTLADWKALIMTKDYSYFI